MDCWSLAYRGDCNGLRDLEERGALNGNPKSRDGRTMAHMVAGGKKCLQTLEYLFESGRLDMEVKDICGMTVVHWASIPSLWYKAPIDNCFSRLFNSSDEHKCLLVLRWLHSKEKLDGCLEDACGRNVTHIAVQFGHFEIVKWLEEMELFEPKSIGGWNMAHEAAKAGNVESLKWLWKRGMLAELSKAEHGVNVAHTAAYYGRLEILKWMHKKRVLDIFQKDDLEGSVGTWAAKSRHTTLAEWFYSLPTGENSLESQRSTVSELIKVAAALTPCSLSNEK